MVTKLDQPLEVIDLNVSNAVSLAAKAVVRNKYLIDSAVADRGAAMLARDLHDGGYGPAEPLPFLCRIIPFAYTLKRAGKPFFGRAPIANALGCSWRWRRKDLNDSELAECRDLDDEQALVAGTLDNASYAWIKPLGLIAPGEGKNRVDFFREEGVESVPAKITEWAYIEPERIAIYSVKDCAFEATWAVLDGRWVEAVDHPSWTLPLMTAYGVESQLSWPKTFPAPVDVVSAFFEKPRTNSPLGDPQYEHATVVDLHTLEAINEFQSEPQKATVHDLRNVSINPQVWKLAIAGILIAVALLVALPTQWSEARVIAGAILGAAWCAGTLPYLMHIITVPRRGLANDQYLPRERCPKTGKNKAPRLLG